MEKITKFQTFLTLEISICILKQLTAFCHYFLSIYSIQTIHIYQKDLQNKILLFTNSFDILKVK